MHVAASEKFVCDRLQVLTHSQADSTEHLFYNDEVINIYVFTPDQTNTSYFCCMHVCGICTCCVCVYVCVCLKVRQFRENLILKPSMGRGT